MKKTSNYKQCKKNISTPYRAGVNQAMKKKKIKIKRMINIQ